MSAAAESGHYSRPRRPALGPQARYTCTSHDIGLGNSDVTVQVKDHEHGWSLDLEWTLYHLEDFDEPSRHLILAATAFEYGLRFEDVMRGML